MPRNKYINIHLPCNRAQRIKVPSWNRLVSMNHTNLNWVVHNSNGRWKRRFIVVALRDVHVWRNGAQVIIGLLVADIACAKYLLDLSWNQKFLELGREVVYPMWNMKIPDDEDEDHCR